ncbi:ABC-three component system middle component 6 [Thalassotalea profundi]|uniref:Uncharacterized protein n=1 Tax=Thalassotalea profundi TaxID=2036687 RepID=A0ABQ3IHE4_9GAMM|nr:ABC-three component system middle component 6 [Thalassotalea profundi]GHE80140.1 hypothetical protein GCM10011501_04960 [Thalassotalea profundi]
MILNSDSHPQRQLYYLGAKTLEVLSNNGGVADFFDTYSEIKDQENISLMLFVLTLDWLYLLGAIKSEKGTIEICS